jgi:peptidoglycan/xylan/chitin deacetylase (PgdA/CDA1 family)
VLKRTIVLPLMVFAASCATLREGAPQEDTPSREEQEVAMKEHTPAQEGPAEDASAHAGGADNAAGEADNASARDADASRAGILLGFDDDYYESWEAAFGLFEKYGAKATFFVQGNSAFCLRAMERGHDIGYHTQTHPDLRLLSGEAWRQETLESAQTLRDNGVALAAFAYPFGFSEPWMDEELLKTYAVIRGFGVTSHYYAIDAIRAGVIMSKSIDNTVIPEDEAFYTLITETLQAVKDSGDAVIPLTTHAISDDAQWGIKTGRLEYLLKTAAAMGLRFYTYRELADY